MMTRTGGIHPTCFNFLTTNFEKPIRSQLSKIISVTAFQKKRVDESSAFQSLSDSRKHSEASAIYRRIYKNLL